MTAKHMPLEEALAQCEGAEYVLAYTARGEEEKAPEQLRRGDIVSIPTDEGFETVKLT